MPNACQQRCRLRYSRGGLALCGSHLSDALQRAQRFLLPGFTKVQTSQALEGRPPVTHTKRVSARSRQKPPGSLGCAAAAVFKRNSPRGPALGADLGGEAERLEEPQPGDCRAPSVGTDVFWPLLDEQGESAEPPKGGKFSSVEMTFARGGVALLAAAKTALSPSLSAAAAAGEWRSEPDADGDCCRLEFLPSLAAADKFRLHGVLLPVAAAKSSCGKEDPLPALGGARTASHSRQRALLAAFS